MAAHFGTEGTLPKGYTVSTGVGEGRPDGDTPHLCLLLRIATRWA
jgi:hypothetical protein